MLLCLAAATCAAASADNAGGCGSSHYDAAVRVRYVIDGDTVVLSDGDHLRLIGVDTPELAHEGRPEQRGAAEARRFLNTLLHDQDREQIVYGRQRHDSYGRLLAHLFLSDGTNVQARLLEAGRGVPLTIPPNLRFVNCYQAAATLAIRAGRGIWALPQYHPVPVDKLPMSARGYRVVYGDVLRVNLSRSLLWLELGRLAVRIPRVNLKYFPRDLLEELRGAEVEVRGMVNERRGELRMLVRHPADLRLLERSDSLEGPRPSKP